MQIPPEIFYGIGVVVLAVGIAWGVLRNKHLNRANDQVTEAATKEAYEHPETYDEGKFKAQIRRDK